MGVLQEGGEWKNVLSKLALHRRDQEDAMTGVELIAEERQRQVDVEGWTPGHDAEHMAGELAGAARAYTHVAQLQVCRQTISSNPPLSWPDWADEWWKPSDDPIRNLVKAGALIAAEIDRLQRLR